MRNELKNLLRQFAWPEYERGGTVKDQGELRIKARDLLQRLEAEEAKPKDPNPFAFEQINRKFQCGHGLPIESVMITAEEWGSACDWMKRSTNAPVGVADESKLVGLLLDQRWHKLCEIIPDYMPPFPRPETRPTVQIRYNGPQQHEFLRHSVGPLQGFFWDAYGDNFQSVELAIIALSRAPSPVFMSTATQPPNSDSPSPSGEIKQD